MNDSFEFLWHFGKLFKSTLNNRLHRNLACVIDKSSRGAKLERAFEELPSMTGTNLSFGNGAAETVR